MAVQQFLMHRQIVLMLQPLFSEDLTPYDFWLFPRQKMGLQSQRFATLKDFECSAMAGLCIIPKEFFHECSQVSQNCWNKSVYAEGMYLEND
jgi:hypothetical protein